MKVSDELSVRAIKNGIVITHENSMARTIRMIQRSEGNLPCFRTDEQYFCLKDSDSCEWACECKNTLVARWKR